ncbi:MAG: hypothetical protein PHO15_11230 [Eubacteriales bacterium]|nr:hypothetical protein [Eubacteriales bacterium]
MKKTKKSRKKRPRRAADGNKGWTDRKADPPDEIRVVHSDEPNPHDG